MVAIQRCWKDSQMPVRLLTVRITRLRVVGFLHLEEELSPGDLRSKRA